MLSLGGWTFIAFYIEVTPGYVILTGSPSILKSKRMSISARQPLIISSWNKLGAVRHGHVGSAFILRTRIHVRNKYNVD